jgi:hypothetical protein
MKQGMSAEEYSNFFWYWRRINKSNRSKSWRL